MKNKTFLIFAVSLVLLVGSGCGIGGMFHKSEVAPDGEKIGISECDKVFEMLTEQVDPQADEGYITKATRQTIIKSIRDSLREGIKNEKDQEQLKKNCTKYLEQLKKYKAEEDSKK